MPKVRLHDLRHTAATLLIEQGVGIKAVQATLGHSTIATTMDVYAHVTPATQDSVAEAMDRIFERPVIACKSLVSELVSTPKEAASGQPLIVS